MKRTEFKTFIPDAPIPFEGKNELGHDYSATLLNGKRYTVVPTLEASHGLPVNTLMSTITEKVHADIKGQGRTLDPEKKSTKAKTTASED